MSPNNNSAVLRTTGQHSFSTIQTPFTNTVNTTQLQKKLNFKQKNNSKYYPTRGAQATSRTQSVCSANSCSHVQPLVAGSCNQIYIVVFIFKNKIISIINLKLTLMRLSQPPDANRSRASAPCAKSCGAHDTQLTPI